MDAPIGSAIERALHHDDMNAARELLEEVERRLRKPEYIIALFTEIGSTAEHASRNLWYVSFNDLWALIAATPEQHARAFMKVLS